MRAITNVVKAGLLFAVLPAGLVGLGSLLARRSGSGVGLVLGLGLVAVTWWSSDRLAVRFAGAKALRTDEYPWLWEQLQTLATRSGMVVPRLYLSPSPQPNAFATGSSPRHAVVVLTEGLVHLLEPTEVQAVLAHELAHVCHRDTLLTSVSAALATAISPVAPLAPLGPNGGSGDDQERPRVASLVVSTLFAPVGAGLLQLTLARSRAVAADRFAGELIGTRYSLAAALQRIDGYARRLPLLLPPAQAQAWIVSPLRGGGLTARMFSTHPPLAERIARLRDLDGIVDNRDSAVIRRSRTSRSNCGWSGLGRAPRCTSTQAGRDSARAHARLLPSFTQCTAAIAVGAALGITSRVADSLAVPLQATAEAGGPWLVVAFAIGALASRLRDGAMLGATTLVCATATYYGYIEVVQNGAGRGSQVLIALLWTTIGIGAGALFGALGCVWRKPSVRVRVRAVAVGFLTGALVGEGVVLAAHTSQDGSAWLAASVAELGLGLAAPWLLLRSKQLLATATGLGVLGPAAMIVAVLLGALAGWATH